jgi:hypothetical protein
MFFSVVYSSYWKTSYLSCNDQWCGRGDRVPLTPGNLDKRGSIGSRRGHLECTPKSLPPLLRCHSKRIAIQPRGVEGAHYGKRIDPAPRSQSMTNMSSLDISTSAKMETNDEVFEEGSILTIQWLLDLWLNLPLLEVASTCLQCRSYVLAPPGNEMLQ